MLAISEAHQEGAFDSPPARKLVREVVTGLSSQTPANPNR
jgi:hypothetical protein